jgi:hypothetical protein
MVLTEKDIAAALAKMESLPSVLVLEELFGAEKAERIASSDVPWARR